MASIILDLVKRSIFFPGWNIQRVSSGSWDKNQNPSCVWAGFPPFDSCFFLQTRLAPSPFTPSLGFEAVFTQAHHWQLISEGSRFAWQILLLPLDPICGRQSNEPQRCPGPNPNSMEPVNMRLHGRWGIKAADGVKVAIHWSSDWEIILDFLGGPSQIRGGERRGRRVIIRELAE